MHKINSMSILIQLFVFGVSPACKSFTIDLKLGSSTCTMQDCKGRKSVQSKTLYNVLTDRINIEICLTATHIDSGKSNYM